MNADDTQSALTEWSPTEQIVLLLSREQEWAEAYALENPQCQMGRLYLDFLWREMTQMMGDL